MIKCYISEYTGKKYDTEEECAAADKKYVDSVNAEAEAKKKKDAERDADAKAIQSSYDKYLKLNEEAHKQYEEYRKLLNEFTNKYNSFHFTITHENLEDFDNLFSWFF